MHQDGMKSNKSGGVKTASYKELALTHTLFMRQSHQVNQPPLFTMYALFVYLGHTVTRHMQ